MKPERAAAITDPSQLPEALRGPTAKLLLELGRTMTAEGYPAAQVAGDVIFLLQRIALAEHVPALAQARDYSWPPMMNSARRAFTKLCSPPPAPRKHNLDPALHRTNQTATGRLALGGRHAEEESPRGDQETEE